MERNIKRFLSLVLAFVMVFGMMPANVFAVEDYMCDTCGSSLYVTGWCEFCNTGCDHSAGYDEGVCGVCKSVCSHVWNSNSCTVCRLICNDCTGNHTVEGKCKICGSAVGHTFEWYGDNSATCEICGAPNPNVVTPEEPEPPQVDYVAQIGDQGYETLTDAIAAASAGSTITLIGDVTEDVTVNKDLTIDGAGKNYTGNIAVKGSTVDIVVKNVNFVNGTGYAITTNSIKSVTIEDCTVKDYGYGFLYANKSTTTINVKDVTVDGCNYGMHWVYGSTATLENVNMTNVGEGIRVQNYAKKTLTLTNCTILAEDPIYIWERSGYSAVQTINIGQGNNFGGADMDFGAYAKVVGAEVLCDNVIYASYGEAYAAAENGSVLKLVADLDVDAPIVIEKNISLDLNGKTITGLENVYPVVRIQNDANVTVLDSKSDADVAALDSENEGGSIVNETDYIFVLGASDGSSKGNLTIENGIFKGATTVASVTKGELTILGGSFEVVDDATYLLNCIDANYRDGSAKISVQGGTFKGFDPMNNAAEGAGTNFCAVGYESVDNGDGTWTVKKPAYVAQIGEQGYETLTDAIAAVQNGETIVLLTDSAESVTIKQVANMSFTIDGNGKTYSGTITIHGNKRSTGKETLTIKNVNFVVSSSGIYTTDKTYAHNITVDNCTFTGVEGAAYAYGIALRAAYNVTVSNSKGENLYGFIYAPKAVTGITVDTVEVNDSVVGIYLQSVNQKPAVFKNLNLNVTDSGVKIASESVTTATFEDCSIVAPIPVKVQKNTNDRKVNLTFIGSNNFGDGNWLTIEGTTADIVVDLTEDTNLDIGNVIYEEGVYGIVTEGEKHTFTELPSVAAIGDKEYKTIQAAVDAAQDGETVKLIADVTLTEADRVTSTSDNVMVYVANKDITLDMNGKTISLIHEDTFADGYIVAVIEVGDGAGLTVTGNGTIDVNAYDGEYKKADIAYTFFKRGTTGHLTIQNGTYHMDNSADSMIYTHGDRIVTVNGGTFILDTVGTGNNECPWIFNTQGQNEKSIVVTGGTYNTDVSDQYWEGEVYIPDGYICEDNGDGTWTVREGKWMAQIAETGKKYETLTAAIAAAASGQTITLLADINENVSVDKNITIEGAEFNYTGTMNITKGISLTVQNLNFVSGKILKGKDTGKNANLTLKQCNFDGQGLNAYAVELRESKNIVIEDCTAKDYGYGFLQLPKSNVSLSVKNVEITDVNYGFKIDYSNGVTMENVVVEGARIYGIYDSNYAAKTYNIKNCSFDAASAPIKIWDRNTGKTTTFLFEGTNSFGATAASLSGLGAMKLAEPKATLAGVEGMDVTTDLEGYEVAYENGIYRLAKHIAQNTNTGAVYTDLSDGLKEAVSDQTVILLAETAEELVLVPAGVTFDLNGHVVKADNVLSFGIVKDSAETVGGIQIDKDTTEAFTKLQPKNGGYLPIYDTRDGMYKFFGFELVSLGRKPSANGNDIKFGVRLAFDNQAGYEVLANTTDSRFDLVLDMQWTGVTEFEIHYVMKPQTVREYAAAAYQQVRTGSDNTKCMSATVKGVAGLGSGSFISATPNILSKTEVVGASDTMRYDIP